MRHLTDPDFGTISFFLCRFQIITRILGLRIIGQVSRVRDLEVHSIKIT
jgi:hypothetical protein